MTPTYTPGPNDRLVADPGPDDFFYITAHPDGVAAVYGLSLAADPTPSPLGIDPKYIFGTLHEARAYAEANYTAAGVVVDPRLLAGTDQ